MNKYSQSKYLFISKLPLHAPNPLNYYKTPENHGMSRSDISVKDLRYRIGREIVQYGSNLTHGIQDIYGGVYKEYNAHSGGGTMWGHTWDYWTRGNRSFEVTSEAWANMFDAAFSPKCQAAMKEFLPTAWEWFERRLGGLR